MSEVTEVEAEREEIETFEVGSAINDRFRVVRILGAGGFGCVYLVEDLEHGGAKLALKTIQPSRASAMSLDLFCREFAELTKLKHPNIGASLEYGRIAANGQHFFTGEYIDAIDLLAGTETSTVEEKIEFTAQICRALEFVHNRGLIHHDLKPGNILLAVPTVEDQQLGEIEGLGRLEMKLGDRSRIVKLIDFGLIEHENLAADMILGTPAYMSPERIQCRETDRRSDLYSLGMLLFRIFTRVMPFRASNSKEWIQAHLQRRPAPARKIDDSVPPGIEALIARLLEKDPARRFASAAEVVEGLNAAVGTQYAVDTRETSTQYLVSGPIIGRSAEQETLHGLVDAAAEKNPDSPRSALVTGDPGLGVSRLLDDVRYHAQKHGAIFLQLDARTAPSLPELTEQIRRALTITGHRFDVSTEWAATASVKALRAKVEEALKALTMLAPVVVAIDHVQAAQDSVVEFCRELAVELQIAAEQDDGQALLVVGNSGGADAVPLLRDDAPLHPVVLGPLDDAAVTDLLRESFRMTDPPEGFVRRLARASSGNPLYVVETLRDLTGKGVISRVGNDWVFPTKLELVELPESLTHLVAGKFTDFSEQVREVLAWIAVYRSPMPTDLLDQLLDLPDDRVRGILWGQVKANLLCRVRHRCPQTGAVEELYRFTSDSLRRAIYDSMPVDRRTAIHHAIATKLTEDGSDHSAETLAYHWLAAGEMESFLDSGFEAAASLHARGELEEAKGTYSQCLEALPPTDLKRRFQALAKISELEEASGDPSAAAAAATRLFDSGQRFLKPRDKGRLRRRIGLLSSKAGDDTEALRWIDDASNDLAEESELDRVAVLAARAHLIQVSPEIEVSGDDYDQCVRMLARIDDPTDAIGMRLLSSACDLVGKCAHLRGDHARGLEAFRRSRDLCVAADSPQGAAASLANSGWLNFEIGHYEDALAMLDTAIDESRELGDRPALARALSGRAEALLARGETSPALQAATEAVRAARIGGDSTSIARTLTTLGAIRALAGDRDGARDNLEAAISGERAGSYDAAIAAARLGRISSQIDADEARIWIDTALNWGDRLGAPRILCLAHLAAAFLHVEGEGVVPAKAALETAAELGRRHRFRRELAEALLLSATLDLCGKNVDGAKASLGEAAEAAGTIGAADLTEATRRLTERVAVV